MFICLSTSQHVHLIILITINYLTIYNIDTCTCLHKTYLCTWLKKNILHVWYYTYIHFIHTFYTYIHTYIQTYIQTYIHYITLHCIALHYITLHTYIRCYIHTYGVTYDRMFSNCRCDTKPRGQPWPCDVCDVGALVHAAVRVALR